MPSSVYFDLVEACRRPGCPVCRLAQDAAQHYLESFFYENVNDVGMRGHLRRSLGFCREHAWQAIDSGVGDSLSEAILYHDILGNVLKKLPETPPTSAAKTGILARLGISADSLTEAVKGVVQALTPKEPCPACVQRKDMTGIVLTELAASVGQAELLKALAASAGLCLPHLRQALKKAPGEAASRALLSIHRPKLEALDRELAEIIRKSDYRFREEEFGPERDAWKRAVEVVVGSRMG